MRFSVGRVCESQKVIRELQKRGKFEREIDYEVVIREAPVCPTPINTQTWMLSWGTMDGVRTLVKPKGCGESSFGL